MFRRRTPVLLQVVSCLVCYLDLQKKFDVEHKRELRFCLMFSFLFSFAKEIKSWPCERVKILQVYLPSGLFVIVSWISFIVPPEVVPGYTFSIFTFTFHNWFIVPPEVVPGYTFCFSLSLFIIGLLILLKLLQVSLFAFHSHFSWWVYIDSSEIVPGYTFQFSLTLFIGLYWFFCSNLCVLFFTRS